MKTTKIIAMTGIILLLLATGAANALNNSNYPPQQNDKVKFISYIVRIADNHQFKPGDNPFHIIVTDETGRLVAPPQIYRPGVWAYRFIEAGDVHGTRIAKMIPAGEPVYSNWFILPSAKTGYFYGNHSYLFNLVPRQYKVPAGDAKD